MKLTKQQIHALANKFRSELVEAINKNQEAEKENIYKKYKPLFIKVKKILANTKEINEINIKLTKNRSSSITRQCEENNWISSYVMDDLLKKSSIPYIEDVTNDIILATIDAQSVEDIMKTLKQKYK